METSQEYRKKTLDHHIDERFAEIFFLAKDEYDIENNSEEELKLYDLLSNFKLKLKKKCVEHFHSTEDEENDG